MSKLASCQIIESLTPIPGADNIITARILGWDVVVKKGEFKVGDKCCYICIDTIVPEKPEFEFLRERGFRVKTIKLRKQISQGLIIPLPKGGFGINEYSIDDDLTDIIGVKKYEKVDNNPAKYEKPRVPKIWYKKWVYLFKYNVLYKAFPNLRKKVRSPFPTNLVSITDEERIQNIPRALEQYRGKDFIVSHKLDGSSITIIHNKVLGVSKYRICSRKFELHDNKNDWYNTFVSTEFHNHIIALIIFFKTNDIIVQGECIGKFNGNHHKLDKDEIRLFNIYVDGKRLTQDHFIDICKQLNIPHCPLYKRITLNHSLEDILKISDIPDVLNPKVPAEGLVWRCINDNFSFKVINNNYLLKEK